MNKETLAGKWHELKGNVKEKWGKLTENDITQINGKREALLGKLEARYGYAKEKAEKEIQDFEKSCGCAGEGRQDKNQDHSRNEKNPQRERMSSDKHEGSFGDKNQERGQKDRSTSDRNEGSFGDKNHERSHKDRSSGDRNEERSQKDRSTSDRNEGMLADRNTQKDKTQERGQKDKNQERGQRDDKNQEHGHRDGKNHERGQKDDKNPSRR